MIEIAQKNKKINTIFETHNAIDFTLNRKFDVILSLFHVISYQNSNENLNDFVKNVSSHLNKNALFIFDFWYGPAVLTQMPSIKIKRLENDEIKVTRISEPSISENENIVDVNFELIIKDKIKNETDVVNERHPMRYFFLPELIQVLNNNNIEVLNFEEFMTKQKPSFSTWGVCCIAKKM